MIQPVILCGGDGTRLWPASRKALPKQFMPLQEATLFERTLARAAAIPGAAPALVLCNQEHRFLAAAQAQTWGEGKSQGATGAIILEPCGRNTAPAAAVAALHCAATDPVLLVLPADHAIADIQGFVTAVLQALPAAEAGELVTFGVTPTGPETGYGYIQCGTVLSTTGVKGVLRVQQFIEKPSATRAASFLAAGGYYWNSGIFMFKGSAFLRELGLHSPAILEACQKAYAGSEADLDFIRLDTAAFTNCPADSIDYAVMEHTQQACLTPLTSDWSDLGSWQNLCALEQADAFGNASVGDVLLAESSGSYVLSTSRLVAGLGLKDMVVVETRDAVMVAPKNKSQEVKTLVAALREAGRIETEQHSKVYRPWGSFESLVTGGRFQVKRIIVSPGHRLSLQKHYHRAEHWVVVRGTALVTLDEREILLKEDQSTYIPTGAVHRLTNPGKVLLEIIEIQTGSYLGEDDIVRLEDQYGRSK